jgi:WD40 repeat protein
MNDAESKGDVVDQLAEEFLARYRRSERPSVQEYADQYPEHAAQIRDLFPALVALERVAPAGDSEFVRPGTASAALASAGLPEQLGDFRIVREIGRGGMGVVYEAEQQALGRRVALKVLNRNGSQDAKVLARFRRESRAAAQLHHTNIVPVFEVGQQGDLCYYAMQFIRGQALDEVFRELQRLRAGSTSGLAKEAAAPAGALAQSLWTGKYEPAADSGTVDHKPGATPAIKPVPEPAETTAAALPDHSELSSVASNYQRYCRNLARLGLQVAQALAYAHAHGIIHRDIKPANLLLDTSGVLWVSDFGLVKTQDPALTDTGDLVGTLRYMAPERFRGECDALADVYALGLTLYELLVLRPAFDGKDRLRLVEQIGRQEPARLRVLDPRIPRDLETILMKAIEKDPRRRYASADDMAEDLHRYLADELIKARRIGPLERLGRWGRRNPLVAGLSAVVVLIIAIGFAGVFGEMQVAQSNEHKAQEHAAQTEKERDEVRALNQKLQATQAQLQHTLYAAHMNLAQQAWEAGGAGRVLDLLEQHRPKLGESDLRGFEWDYLNRLCHSDLLTLKGHTDAVTSIAYSPDGKRLASASWDKTMKMWDAQTGQELRTFKGHTDDVNHVVYSPDGKRLASASGNGTVNIWDAQTGQELLTLKGHTGEVNSVAFSPDGKRLASGSGMLNATNDAFAAGEVKVWDAQTGQDLFTLKGHSSVVGRVAFSADGKRLASASDKTVKLWDAQTGQELLTLKGHAGEVNSVAFSPDGKCLASASEDEMVKVWDAETGQELLTFKGHAAGVTGVVFRPDGKRLASASKDGTLKVWDAQTGQKPLILHATPTGFSGHAVAFSPDGKRLASGGRGRPGSGPGEVKVWDAQTGREIVILKGHTAMVTTVAYSPDGKRLASGSGTWDVTKQAYVGLEVKVWDAQTGQELLTLKGHTGEVNGVAFSPDGRRLASASGGELKVWDALTGQDILTLKGHSMTVGGVAFSPDGKRLASAEGKGGKPGEVKLWDAWTGQELQTLKGHIKGVLSVAFSPDGKRLASTGWDSIVKVWDAETGQELLSCKGHNGLVTSVAFSPDGKRLASAGGLGLKVWDAETGQELLTFKGDVRSVAFSPDGHRLASGSNDGTVKIWDAMPLPEKP